MRDTPVTGFAKLGRAAASIQRGFLFVLMAILTAAMLAEIITRYFFGTSLFGLEAFVGFTAVWLFFIGAAYGAYERSHIKAEFLNVFVKNERTRNFIRGLAGIISVLMSLVFLKWSYEFCLESIEVGEVTPTGRVPMIIFQAALPVGGVLMTFYFAVEAWDYITRFINPARPAPAGDAE